MPVMRRQCATCPFREGADRELRHRIEERVLTSASQTCHHTGTIHGREDTHLCRGARDHQLQFFYRLGVIAAATDAAWKKAQAKLARQRAR
jgi:hypothetical protein